MNTDELIRQAFERQARNVPDPGRVLAGFRVRAHRARRRRALTRAAAAAASAAAVAVAVPVVLVGQNSLSERPESIDRRARAGPLQLPIRLEYRPTWIPYGFVEQFRSITTGDRTEQVRSWGDRAQLNGGSSGTGRGVVDVRVEMRGKGGRQDVLQWLSRQPDLETPVMVKGHRAERRHDGMSCVVAWGPISRQVLSVTVRDLADPCGNAVRVARSVVHEHRAMFVSPLRVDWLPAGYVQGRTNLSRTRPACSAEVVAEKGQDSITIELSQGRLEKDGSTRLIDGRPAQIVQTGRTPITPVGRPWLIGGRPARYYPGSPEEPANAMVVDLGAGRLLVVREFGSEPRPSARTLGQIAADTFAADTFPGGLAETCAWP